MNDPGIRMGKAFLRAIAAFVITGIVACNGFMFLVRNSHDGQAGMGAAFGAFYAACLAMIITFIWSLVRSSPSRSK
jgi:O-antigen/teichoic acid export membrane protein